MQTIGTTEGKILPKGGGGGVLLVEDSYAGMDEKLNVEMKSFSFNIIQTTSIQMLRYIDRRWHFLADL